MASTLFPVFGKAKIYIKTETKTKKPLIETQLYTTKKGNNAEK